MKKKLVICVAAMVAVIGCAIGGTLAWLTQKTDPIVNTFTIGDINIALTESENLDLKMLPGCDITKDPKVTVEAESEACWLFVKIEKSDSYDDYLNDYVIDDATISGSNWTALTGAEGVYYREVDATATELVFPVLKDNKVSVLQTVTKADMEAISEGTVSAPMLTFTAYAIQKEAAVDALAAWNIAKSIA